MGLDMYAYTTSEKPAMPVDFEPKQKTQIHYWRKHPDLHGWMENLYREKGGSAENFNCAAVQLDAADIDRLEAAIKTALLPHTTGFFFGTSDGTEYADDLTFVRDAREALSAGLTVFYSSWW